MSQMVDEARISTIIIKDMSRLGRDYLNVGQYIEMLRQRNVRLIAVHDGKELSKIYVLYAPIQATYKENQSLKGFAKMKYDSISRERTKTIKV